MEGIQEPADAQPDIEEELTEQCTLARMRWPRRRWSPSSRPCARGPLGGRRIRADSGVSGVCPKAGAQL